MQNSWTEITIDEVSEMSNFIGLALSMRLISMPCCKKYCSKEMLFKKEPFLSVMARESFECAIQFFNFGEKILFENNRLSKLHIILDHLNKVMFHGITHEKKSFDR